MAVAISMAKVAPGKLSALGGEREGARGLRREGRGLRSFHLHVDGYSAREHSRVRADRGARHSDRRPDHRLRRIVGERKEAEGWFDVSTLKEPYRVEGKKTMDMSWPSNSTGNYPTVFYRRAGDGSDRHVEGL